MGALAARLQEPLLCLTRSAPLCFGAIDGLSEAIRRRAPALLSLPLRDVGDNRLCCFVR